MVKIIFPTMCMMLIAALPCCAVTDSLYFLFQRSTYLENLSVPCAWWANPAIIAETNKKTALMGTVTPLGNVYTIASARYAAPAFGRFGWGIGILAAGINTNPDGSSNGGAQYSSQIGLSNPSFQLGCAARTPGNFLAGVLLDFGAEELPDGSGQQSNFAKIGMGIGAITPYFMNKISLALSYMSTGHFWYQPYWDHDGKAGMRFKSSDSLIMGSIEYTFSLASGTIENIYNSPATYYQVVKGLVSIKALGIVGGLVGYSQDLGILSDNGPMVHGGVELRQSTLYRFFGGYEIGIATTQRNRDLIVHRLWLGYYFL